MSSNIITNYGLFSLRPHSYYRIGTISYVNDRVNDRDARDREKNVHDRVGVSEDRDYRVNVDDVHAGGRVRGHVCVRVNGYGCFPAEPTRLGLLLAVNPKLEIKDHWRCKPN